jgi:Flp pilus assembly protein TadD
MHYEKRSPVVNPAPPARRRTLQDNLLALFVCALLSGCAQRGRNQDLYQKYDAALSRRDYDTAITCMDEVLKRDPRSAWAYADLGAAYEAKGDLDSAIDNYEKAVRLKPKDAEFHYDLGSALGRRGDLQRAFTNLDEAIRLNPNHAQAYGNRGTTSEKAGDYQRAIRDYNEAIRLAPDFAPAYAARGTGVRRERRVRPSHCGQ